MFENEKSLEWWKEMEKVIKQKYLENRKRKVYFDIY